MKNNSIVIATSAGFFAEALREKLRDASFQVFVATTDEDLAVKMKMAFPRFVFIEHCFHGYGTDAFVQRMVKQYRDLHVVVWAASEVKPFAAARFIFAGAESFFSLRDTDSHVEAVIYRIAGGRHYCPADVEAVIDKNCMYPLIGEELTRREIEVIKMSIAGQTNQEIADFMRVSVHAVRFHKSNIYRKCGGNTPMDILRNGLLRGIIHTEDFLE
jgi:DNA-binding NarL/FixJ family response regulator